MVRAVIDLGTNSVKCVIARVDNGRAEILLELNKTTRLGGGIAETGKIGQESMERNLGFLREIARNCRELKAEEVVCVGAETMRRAEDAEVFKALVKGEFGWELHTLSPEEEARLIYEASAKLAPPGVETLVFDTGGGSTEFTFGQNGGISSSYSLPLGAVILTSRYVNSDPISDADFTALTRLVEEQISQNLPRQRDPFTIGCGGCLTTLAAVALKLEEYDAEKVHGYELSKVEVEMQARLYRDLNGQERKIITGLPAERADIILAGAVVVLEVFRFFNLSRITISSRGLRHALLSDEA
ncbi:MAG: hypothetical protein ACP5F3_00260 [Candidatus Syntrophosphaera sp.]